MGCHVLPDGMPRDGEVEVVDEELHQDAQRHGAVGLRFFLDEVFDLIENLTDWTWPSRRGNMSWGRSWSRRLYFVTNELATPMAIAMTFWDTLLPP